MNPLFDSTDLIYTLRSQPEALQIFDLADESFDEVYTSTMNVAEVFGGVRLGEEKKTAQLPDGLTLLPVTPEIARKAGQLKTEWSRKGRTFGLADMIVAATSLEHGLALVTQNRKDFPIEGLTFWP